VRGDDPQVQNLKNRLKAQQDEISKLLLTIDELRGRIEKIKEFAGEDPEVSKKLGNIMDRVGLKDMMDVGTGPGSGPKLKGVFERLYQDAIQRIQRLGLIRERMVLANHAYDAVVVAMQGGAPPRNMAEVTSGAPDLARLNATAGASLRGMWYHTDFLFQNACDYAMAQGVEASAMKGTGHASLEELMDDDELCEMESPDLSRRPGNRPGVRRGGRPKPLPGAYGGGNDSKAFWQMPAGLNGSMSPRQMRKLNIRDPVNTSFTSYVAAIREARGDIRPDEWPNCERRRPKKGERDPDRIGSLVNLPGKGVSNSPKGMSNSQSLPSLPANRSLMQQAAEGVQESSLARSQDYSRQM